MISVNTSSLLTIILLLLHNIIGFSLLLVFVSFTLTFYHFTLIHSFRYIFSTKNYKYIYM